MRYPYIVLDCPRLFSARSICAFRTMFWWGHEFSITFHLQGHALEKYRTKISQKIETLKGRDFYLCINDTPWQYHFEKDNYIPVDELKNIAETILSKPFIKLSRKLPIGEHKKVFSFFLETFKQYFELLS